MSAPNQEILDKYPSLKKFAELGDDYVEMVDVSQWKDGREARVLEYVKQRPDFDQIQNNPLKLLAAMDEFAAQQDFLISIGSDKARVLTNLLAQEQPRTVVELGGYVGYSAIFFAHELRRQALPGEKVQVWSLEFEPEFAKIIEEFVHIAGLSDIVTVVTGSGDQSLRGLKESGKVSTIDLLFLDHHEDLYEQDLKVAEDLGLLKSGSAVLADNVVRPGAPQYRQYVRAHAGWKSYGIPGLIVPGEYEDEFEFSKVL